MRNNMNNQFGDSLAKDLDSGLVLEWAELYALDALPDEERAEIESYLSSAAQETRSAFDNRVAAARQTLLEAYGSLEAEPPADLFGSILSELPASGSRRQGESEPLETAAPVSDLSQHREQKRKKFAPAKWLISAAAAAAVVVGGVTVAQNMQPESIADQVMTAADTQKRTLDIAGGSAEISVSESTDAAVVSLHDVPPPPEGKVYQMWRIPADGTAPVPAGTMTGEDVANGAPTALEDIDPYSALAFTIEPEGGSTTPTMPVIASIPLES